MVNCYMCGKKATSKEHVPPKCLFPESKDIPEFDLRNDLITVPSCEIHNMQKSNEDEYLMMVLSNIKGNNFFGHIQWNSKIDRALKRKEQDYFDKKILINPRIRKEKVYDIEMEIKYGDPDYKRLLRCFEHISYGLYYNEFKTRFKGNVNSNLGFIEYFNTNLQKHIDMVFHLAKTDPFNLAGEFKGSNPKIFQYQFHKPDAYGIQGLMMKFFEGAEVFTAFSPKEFKREKTLTEELISNGTPIIIDANGKNFNFNMNEKDQ